MKPQLGDLEHERESKAPSQETERMIIKIVTQLSIITSLGCQVLQYFICTLHPASPRAVTVPTLQMQKQRVPETQHGKVWLPL